MDEQGLEIEALVRNLAEDPLVLFNSVLNAALSFRQQRVWRHLGRQLVDLWYKHRHEFALGDM